MKKEENVHQDLEKLLSSMTKVVKRTVFAVKLYDVGKNLLLPVLTNLLAMACVATIPYWLLTDNIGPFKVACIVFSIVCCLALFAGIITSVYKYFRKGDTKKHAAAVPIKLFRDLENNRVKITAAGLGFLKRKKPHTESNAEEFIPANVKMVLENIEDESWYDIEGLKIALRLPNWDVIGMWLHTKGYIELSRNSTK